ncbi:MAG: hypothetical protein GF331_17505 [Chitinivibrionales bacterium]|nr:hypothetical protein [Chitinivibrionales bacterium]
MQTTTAAAQSYPLYGLTFSVDGRPNPTRRFPTAGRSATVPADRRGTESSPKTDRSPSVDSRTERLRTIFRKKLRIDEPSLNGLTVKIAETPDELEQAFRVVHDSYVDSGYMAPSASGMRLCLQQAMPRATTVIGVQDGEVKTTLTIFPDSFCGLPMDSLFGDELASLRAAGRLIAEVGAFASKPGFKQNNPNIILHLMKLMVLYAMENLHVEDVVITINPKHRLFYEAIWGFSQMGDEKAYDKVGGNPAILLRLNLVDLRGRLEKLYDGAESDRSLLHFIYSAQSRAIDGPKTSKPVRALNRTLLKHFFERQTDLFAQVEPSVVRRIESLYPQECATHA